MDEIEQFDIDGFVAAMVAKDAERWSAYYAPGAEWLEYRHDQPPASPKRFEGREAITEFVEEICAADLTIEVEDPLAGDGIAWYRVDVALGDGRRIVEHVRLRTLGRLITQQVDVEAWDQSV
jgi:hypothetical protein